MTRSVCPEQGNVNNQPCICISGDWRWCVYPMWGLFISFILRVTWSWSRMIRWLLCGHCLSLEIFCVHEAKPYTSSEYFLKELTDQSTMNEWLPWKQFSNVYKSDFVNVYELGPNPCICPSNSSPRTKQLPFRVCILCKMVLSLNLKCFYDEQKHLVIQMNPA